MDKPDQHRPSRRAGGGIGHLEVGRAAYARRAWEDAWQALRLADRAAPLAVEDLERLAMSAYLTSRDEDYLQTLKRAHHAYLESGKGVLAARAAFWLGLRLAFRGDTGPASGWLGRAETLLRREGKACVQEGYLLLPLAEQTWSLPVPVSRTCTSKPLSRACSFAQARSCGGGSFPAIRSSKKYSQNSS